MAVYKQVLIISCNEPSHQTDNPLESALHLSRKTLELLESIPISINMIFPSPTKTFHTTAYPSLSPTRPELSQKGKTVLITGGGTGIGAGIAHAFAEAGASRIALLGRREQPLLDTKASIEKQYPGVQVFTQSTDGTKVDQVNAAFEAFVPLDSGKKIDVVVSNAAVPGPLGPFLAVSDEDFLGGVTGNITLAWNLARAFLPRAAPDATVIDVNSSASHMLFMDGFGSYSVAKWANVRLWQLVQFNNPGLAVYSIQPGVVETDMNKAVGGTKAIGHEDHGKFVASLTRRRKFPGANVFRYSVPTFEFQRLAR